MHDLLAGPRWAGDTWPPLLTPAELPLTGGFAVMAQGAARGQADGTGAHDDDLGVVGSSGRFRWHGSLGLENGWVHAGQMPGTSTFRNRCGLTVAVSG